MVCNCGDRVEFLLDRNWSGSGEVLEVLPPLGWEVCYEICLEKSCKEFVAGDRIIVSKSEVTKKL